MRRPRRGSDDDERILPLVNVVFLLLIFFMVAGRLTADGPFPIRPPESASAASPAEGRVIAVGPHGELALDGRAMSEAELLAALADAFAAAPTPEIRIKADGRAEAVALVALLAGLRQLGAETVTLMTVAEGT